MPSSIFSVSSNSSHQKTEHEKNEKINSSDLGKTFRVEFWSHENREVNIDQIQKFNSSNISRRPNFEAVWKIIRKWA